MGPEIAPNLMQQITKIGSSFGSHFFEVWELLYALGRKFQASWSHLGMIQKRQSCNSPLRKPLFRFRFFVSWGSDWPPGSHLFASWDNLEPKRTPKMGPSSCPKVVPKFVPNRNRFLLSFKKILGPFRGPKTEGIRELIFQGFSGGPREATWNLFWGRFGPSFSPILGPPWPSLARF